MADTNWIHRSVRCAIIAGASICLANCNDSPLIENDPVLSNRSCITPDGAAIEIAGGDFLMGDDRVYPSQEGPPLAVSVGRFWIDRHEVTNRQFAEFVDATGYQTFAERAVDTAQFEASADAIPSDLLLPGSAVFVAPEMEASGPSDWWVYVPGANWRLPMGPDGDEAEADSPVVHLVAEDMVAYADWKGGRLPSEAEWEFAAKAGKHAGVEQPAPGDANSWQGVFPLVNEQRDGFAGAAPVGCFAPNAFGLYDMIGNVWEVTADPYSVGSQRPYNSDIGDLPQSTNIAIQQGSDSTIRVMKGGSFLCAPNYCRRYRAAARQGRDPSLGASNVGFRLVYDEMPK